MQLFSFAINKYIVWKNIRPFSRFRSSCACTVHGKFTATPYFVCFRCRFFSDSAAVVCPNKIIPWTKLLQWDQWPWLRTVFSFLHLLICCLQINFELKYCHWIEFSSTWMLPQMSMCRLLTYHYGQDSCLTTDNNYYNRSLHMFVQFEYFNKKNCTVAVNKFH